MLTPAQIELQLKRIHELQVRLRAALLADELTSVASLLDECGARLACVLDVVDACVPAESLQARLSGVLAAHRALIELVARQLPLTGSELRKAGDLKRIVRGYSRGGGMSPAEASLSRTL